MIFVAMKITFSQKYMKMKWRIDLKFNCPVPYFHKIQGVIKALYSVQIIVVDVEDGLKFACIDFSSQQQKRRKALCIQTDLFLSFPITQPSFPINPLV